MSMGLKDKHAFDVKRLRRSIGYASEGIRLAFSEPNFRFHCVFAAAVVMAGFFLSIARWEWIVVCMLIAGMLALEMINTAIEKTIDLMTGHYHPLAKAAKDLSAGAVLLYACLSVIIGFLIFGPKIIDLFYKS
ncbi:undecaprenol kinase [Bacillus ectoiniformans]|uniref:diacylglycerol kinase family protein n=1 Tax=Bacillus ectoiniformans TaxID=1494429 RepID=UPI001959F73E|nr:diacylglycerol kinase family protein [Bacillus ectoiniformans]MBM7650000.1 undecaprenol kinase [Bacillus ectoiniformans]